MSTRLNELAENSRVDNRVSALADMYQNNNSFNAIRNWSAQYNELKIIHLNAQSLFPKIDEFRYLFLNSLIDLICVTETWFTENIKNEMVNLHGYKMFRVDRNGRGGGVAIYVKNGIKCKLYSMSPLDSTIEYLFLSIT